MKLSSSRWSTSVLIALAFILSTISSLALGASPAPPQGANANSPATQTLIEQPDGTFLLKRPASARVSSARTMMTPSTACNAAPPALVSPAAGATSNDLENPRYTWNAVPGITEYIIQIALDSAFDQLLTTGHAYASGQATQVTYTSFDDLEPTTTYYWRVASVCSDGQIGVFPAPSSFQTGSGGGSTACSLPPPALLEPANGAQVATLVPQIAWQRAANTYEYHYQLATDSGFVNRVDGATFIGIDPSRSGNITTMPTDNLTPDTTFYWRVASICADLDSMGSYSSPFSFRSGPAGGTFLPAPQLIAPEDGATTGSIRLTFVFSSVGDAAAYDLRLYESRADAEQDFAVRGYRTSSTTVVAVFNPQTAWFWRVKTRNSYGWGELSEIRAFTTPAVSAATTISPTSGGTLSPSPGYLTINFPSGAVANPTQVNFNLLATPQHALPNYQFANRAFTLEAFAGAQQITHFDKPFTMILSYDPNDLLAAGIVNPALLNLRFWNGQAWQNILPCAGCSIDTTHHTVTVVLDHFTEFALAAPAAKKVYVPAVVR
jgi:hypothetical protein